MFIHKPPFHKSLQHIEAEPKDTMIGIGRPNESIGNSTLLSLREMGALKNHKNFARPPGGHLNGDFESPCSVPPALGVRGMGDPAPLAQPYLVPTRDWGVVVDTAFLKRT